MGMKLAKCFELAKANGGLPAQMRLAMKLGLSADKAAAAPDSPDLIEKAKSAVKEITGTDAAI